MNNIKLKPCPRCGGTARVYTKRDTFDTRTGKFGYYIQCNYWNRCKRRPCTGLYENMEVAAGAWNMEVLER